MTLAVDIKRRFPDLQVFDYDDTAFVKAVLYKSNVDMLEIRVEEKNSHNNFSSDKNKEYWITTRIVTIPDIPEMPNISDEGVEVTTSKLKMLNKIENMLNYARAI